MVHVSKNGILVPKRRRIEKEASSSGYQQLIDDQGLFRPTGSPYSMSFTINDLPDGVLQDILSHLPAPEVVRTSILSRRWRNVWTAVPCLRNENAIEFEGDEDRLINFISSMLENRSDIAPFKVLNIYSPQSEALDFWISYAITHRVESLKFIDDTVMEPFVLDATMTNFSSSHLKELVLHHISLDEIHLNQLNDHCPNLKILKLEEGNLDTSEISSSSLTCLCIKNCTIPGDMLISAPNLTLLRFINSSNRVISLEKLPSLIEASVAVHFNIDSTDDEGWEMENYEHIILQGLSHAKSLELNVPIREPLVYSKELLASHLFSNLTALVLGERCMVDLYPVAWFFQQAPLLKDLHVTLRPRQIQPELQHAPRIFSNEKPLTADCLNNATIIGITTDPMVQELIGLLRSAAKSSLTIKINPDE